VRDHFTRAHLAPRTRGRAEISRQMLREVGVRRADRAFGAGWAMSANPCSVEQAACQCRARAWAAVSRGVLSGSAACPGHAQQEVLVAATADLASELGLPLVATHPIQFLERDDFKAHEARVCIAEGYMLGDRADQNRSYRGAVLQVAGEMASCSPICPRRSRTRSRSPSAATIDHARQELPAGLPDAAEGMTLDDFCARGARLDFEIDTIVQMGFPGYFLIVADFINWAKNNGCPVGPGRGSGAGSLVAYSLKITDLDPAAYALLFERFLNPERVSMPDFDIDFCQANRWR
jgi:DNA polymerase-3 subunit alpha